MIKFEYTKHAYEIIKERDIQVSWIEKTIDDSEWNEPGADGNIHYFKAISENEGRYLHVIVNESKLPNKIVTVYFDRKFGRKE